MADCGGEYQIQEWDLMLLHCGRYNCRSRSDPIRCLVLGQIVLTDRAEYFDGNSVLAGGRAVFHVPGNAPAVSG